LLISRIYPFYLEELILSHSYDRRILRKIDRLYAKCSSLVGVYECYEGPFFKLGMLYTWHIKKNPDEARRWYEKGRTFFETAGQPYEFGLLHYHYGQCLAESRPGLAIALLEKALVQFESCGALFEISQINLLLNSLKLSPAY
jgi:hypothetical protein